ncbi:hypothetical protein BD779DRAFT_1484466 [Infundibulicybe gibba]|nr:hypothetical protein BD779DRAFT_1484466 [Infundibulicybe gibba]
MISMPRKRGPPTGLRIDTPAPHIALTLDESSASALSSATSDSDISPFKQPTKARSLRNMKKLSLTLPSAQSSSGSLHIPETQSIVPPTHSDVPRAEKPRRPSIISLPSTANPTASLIHRKEEEGDPSVPYADGPIQIIPGIWLGSEDNARDWKGLIERGIKSILNVAKEVASPFDSATTQPLRAVANSTYYAPHIASGRPGMHYLKLQWSHGQQDLVDDGFQAAMIFTDAAIERGEGVLIHCQCGISRSATMVIALVMRAAAEHSSAVPPEIWALKGMQGAYSFVKEKSKWVGPNMSLIYQLLEYERKLKGDTGSPSHSERSSIIADEEEEWGRRRRMLDDSPSDQEDERESALVMQEAQALDKAMEERMVARKSSASSITSTSSRVGAGAVWKSRYSARKRTGSIASNLTNGSLISEELVEEEEEQELLGIGGGFDDERGTSIEPEESPASNSPDDDVASDNHSSLYIPNTIHPSSIRPPPSAPVWKTSFSIPPPPATAMRSSFDLTPRPMSRTRRRPPPLGLLPPVPSSPITLIAEPIPPPKHTEIRKPLLSTRPRTESRKPAPPPLYLRNSLLKKPVGTNLPPQSGISTPSQTLFIFPPSPTLTTRTPSTMTLTSTINGAVPFPSLTTPRVSTFRSNGRTRSFIGLGAPATPTTAFSKVDARGYVGLE